MSVCVNAGKLPELLILTRFGIWGVLGCERGEIFYLFSLLFSCFCGKGFIAFTDVEQQRREKIRCNGFVGLKCSGAHF